MTYNTSTNRHQNFMKHWNTYPWQLEGPINPHLSMFAESSLKICLPNDYITATTNDLAQYDGEMTYFLIPAKIEQSTKTAHYGRVVYRIASDHVVNLDNPQNGIEEMYSALSTNQESIPARTMQHFIQDTSYQNDMFSALNQKMDMLNTQNFVQTEQLRRDQQYLFQQVLTNQGSAMTQLKIQENALQIQGQALMKLIEAKDTTPSYQGIDHTTTERFELLPSIQNKNGTISMRTETEQLCVKTDEQKITGEKKKITYASSVLPTVSIQQNKLTTQSLNQERLPSRTEANFPSLPALKPSVKSATPLPVPPPPPPSGTLKSRLAYDHCEFLENGCATPRLTTEYCSLHNDVHHATHFYNPETLKSPYGTIISTFYLNGCSAPTPIYLVAKAETSPSKTTDSHGPTIDLIMNRETAMKFGLSNIHSEIILISLLNLDGKTKTGRYIGRFGTFRRRRPTSISKALSQLSTDVASYYASHESFSSTLVSVIDSCSHLFTELQLHSWPINEIPVLDLTRSLIDDTVIPFYSMPQALAKNVQTLDDVSRNRTLKCLLKCVQFKADRKGLMHGSQVQYHDGKYTTPCGEICEYFEYWRHPCTIRARAMTISMTEKERREIKLATKMIIVPKCLYCERGYKSKTDSVLCNIFCTGVNTTHYEQGKLKPVNPSDRIKPFGK